MGDWGISSAAQKLPQAVEALETSLEHLPQYLTRAANTNADKLLHLVRGGATAVEVAETGTVATEVALGGGTATGGEVALGLSTLANPLTLGLAVTVGLGAFGVYAMTHPAPHNAPGDQPTGGSGAPAPFHPANPEPTQTPVIESPKTTSSRFPLTPNAPNLPGSKRPIDDLTPRSQAQRNDDGTPKASDESAKGDKPSKPKGTGKDKGADASRAPRRAPNDEQIAQQRAAIGARSRRIEDLERRKGDADALVADPNTTVTTQYIAEANRKRDASEITTLRAQNRAAEKRIKQLEGPFPSPDSVEETGSGSASEMLRQIKQLESYLWSVVKALSTQQPGSYQWLKSMEAFERADDGSTKRLYSAIRQYKLSPDGVSSAEKNALTEQIDTLESRRGFYQTEQARTNEQARPDEKAKASSRLSRMKENLENNVSGLRTAADTISTNAAQRQSAASLHERPNQNLQAKRDELEELDGYRMRRLAELQLHADNPAQRTATEGALREIDKGIENAKAEIGKLSLVGPQ